MPKKLDDCVRDVKAEGHDDDSAWGICVDSTGEKPHQESINENRMVPFFNPPLKVDRVEPENRKTTKGIGGDKLNTESALWKDIFDSQLRRNVKEPRI